MPHGAEGKDRSVLHVRAWLALYMLLFRVKVESVEAAGMDADVDREVREGFSITGRSMLLFTVFFLSLRACVRVGVCVCVGRGRGKELTMYANRSDDHPLFPRSAKFLRSGANNHWTIDI